MKKLNHFSNLSRLFWTILLLGAGLSHFFLYDFLLAQMPAYMPMPGGLIVGTGILELLLAAGLQVPHWRRATWWAIAAMCAAYLSVHWHLAWHCEALAEINGPYHLPCWLAWLRLPMQAAFIAWTVLLGRFSAK